MSTLRIPCRYIYLRTNGRSEFTSLSLLLVWHGPYQEVWSILTLCLGRTVNITNFKRTYNHFVEMLLFKMAPMKPPVSVLKKKSYLLEDFPRNASEQLELGSKVWWSTHLYCRAADWWFIRAVNSLTETLWPIFMCQNWVVLLTRTGYLGVPIFPLLWYPEKPAFCLCPLSEHDG